MHSIFTELKNKNKKNPKAQFRFCAMLEIILLTEFLHSITHHILDFLAKNENSSLTKGRFSNESEIRSQKPKAKSQNTVGNLLGGKNRG